MTELLIISLLAMAVCCIPAVIFGSIFHYCLIVYQQAWLAILTITLLAISVGSIMVHVLILFVINKYYTLLLLFAVITTGLCGFFAASLRMFWLKFNQANIENKKEWLKTFILFDLIAATVASVMFLALLMVIID